ncbi:MAG: Xaa-Pro dipeptidyl-peptidase [Phycisphaerae bacterium]|nr:Xaa-Pro dipeptidyl-peptidase [Gemmatimonadaceae bacterium]
MQHSPSAPNAQRLNALGVLIYLAFAGPTLHAQAASATTGKTVPIFVNGQAQVVDGFKDPAGWIRQVLWVETEFDSDGDGKKDRMHSDVTRPRQTETEGLRVPVIYASSPYFAGTSGPRNFLWNVNQELGVEPPPRTSQPKPEYRPTRPNVSTSEVSSWVPRGFAVVHSEAPGTGLSQGCPTVGGAPEELAPKAVIDWLNGRAKGYTSIDGSTEVTATWSTGKVGMTGTSYEGTLPLAAAVTGVKGLEAVIPIAPNTSYYHYYRSNGLVRHPGGWLGEDIDFLYDYIHSGNTAFADYCNRTVRDGLFAKNRSRASGDYNQFWADRDLLPKVKNVKAAVLLAHGFNDWNVVPEHSVRIYEALKKQGTPAQIYLHQGGHGGPPPMEMRNRWFSRYLFGIENGVENDPRAMIVREGGGRGAAPVAYANYPNPAAAAVRLNVMPGGNSIGTFSTGAAPKSAPEKLVDDVQFSPSMLARAVNSNNRLLYATPVLKDSLHLSGTPTLTVRVASNKSAANFSAYLVMLPFDSAQIGSDGRVGVVTRGWADIQNYKALTRSGNFNSFAAGELLKPGQFYTLTFDLQPDDQIIPSGKQLALMIFSSDRDFTLWPKAGTELTIDLNATSISLPVVGGITAFRKATGLP